MVQEKQGLRCDRADVTATDDQAGVGKIKRFKNFRQTIAEDRDINTAA